MKLFDCKILIIKSTGLADNFKCISPKEDFVTFLNNNLYGLISSGVGFNIQHPSKFLGYLILFGLTLHISIIFIDAPYPGISIVLAFFQPYMDFENKNEKMPTFFNASALELNEIDMSNIPEDFNTIRHR